MIEQTDPFGRYFNMLKMRYQEYSGSLGSHQISVPTNKVNLFINIEPAFNYLSTSRDLENKLIINRKYPDDIKVDILNIAGHYKEFFKGNQIDAKIYLYMTDFNSKIEAFPESKELEDFRSYYLLKFRSNPKYVAFGDKFVEDILPDVRMLCDYIPNVYFLSQPNLDSSLLPFLVGANDTDRTNLIITGSLYETQYHFQPGFICHYYKRSVQRGEIICCGVEEYLKELSRVDRLSPSIVQMFSKPAFYRLLLACRGDKYRSIPAIKGYSVANVAKTLFEALKAKDITIDTDQPMLLSKIFPEEVQGDIMRNLMIMDPIENAKLLPAGIKKEVLLQVRDQSDINTLKKINQMTFAKNPLRLEALL